ncbi:hypothetical protein [Halobacteriovorax marinus]|uniref:hypothetical protein n=1 Tax=Halobacteriovorax marinus TaxID=97084 RepID=UPI003A8FCF00
MKLILQSIFAIACLLMVDLSFADEFDTQREACSKDRSKRWDSKLNRCMTTKKAKRGLDRHRNCTLYERKEDRDTCMFNLVKEVSGDAELDDTNWDSLLIDSISFGITVSNLGFSKNKSSPCLSVKIGATCGALSILKTFYVMSEAKKETKDNLDEFLKKAKDKDNYESQIHAYDSQIKQLKTLAKYYNKKKKLNQLIAGCYLGTAAMAIYEATVPTPPIASCEAVAEDDPGIVSAAQEAAGGLWSSIVGGLGSTYSFLSKPMGVASLATINIGWNLVKAQKLGEKGEDADLLAKRSEVIRDQFITSMEKYCPNGHDDKSNLMCYCYENGKKKSNRSNSDSCKALWAQNDRNLFVESSDKTRATGDATTKVGCLTLNGKFDPSCQCKKFKDTQGNNACKKTSFSRVQLAGLGQAVDIERLEKDLNDISSGITGAEGFDMTPAQAQALQTKVREGLIKKITVEDKNGLRQATPNDLAAMEKGLLSNIVKQVAKSPTALDPMDRELAKIQGEVAEEIKAKSSAQEVKKLKLTGGKGVATKNAKKQNFALNLNGSSGNVEQYPEYMNKKYKTKNADVVTNKDVSIFQVLSNRYYKSGFKRLFDE